MRDLRLLDIYRRTDAAVVAHYGSAGDETCGIFMIPSPVRGTLMIIASSGDGWDHVSVSGRARCPDWDEMEHVRRLFFREDEAVMQYHAPVADYVDGSKQGCVNCLHLWRPHDVAIPAPPKWMVGGMSQDEALAAQEREP